MLTRDHKSSINSITSCHGHYVFMVWQGPNHCPFQLVTLQLFCHLEANYIHFCPKSYLTEKSEDFQSECICTHERKAGRKPRMDWIYTDAGLWLIIYAFKLYIFQWSWYLVIVQHSWNPNRHGGLCSSYSNNFPSTQSIVVCCLVSFD